MNGRVLGAAFPNRKRINRMGKKRPNRLRRRRIGHATLLDRKLIGGPFDIPLESDTAQRPRIAKIVRRDAHKQGGVGVGSVARMVAHAIHNHARILTCRANHLATRAHAEAVHVALVFALQMDHELVFRRAERGMGSRRSPLRPVDILLRMLNAHAHREGFRLHMKAVRQHHLEGVACRMPAGKHELSRGNTPGFFSLLAKHRRDKTSLFHLEVDKPRVEKHLATCGDYLTTQIRHHLRQKIAPDMRMRFPKNLRGRAGIGKPMQHMRDPLVLRIGRQLSVGKGSGSAFAKLHVRRGIE